MATPVLNEREQAHMADVRTVFRGLWVLAIASSWSCSSRSRRRDRAATWRAVRGGALGLTVGVVIARGRSRSSRSTSSSKRSTRSSSRPGSFLFDPRTDRLVQLFPFQFWQETAIVVGIVIIAIALGVAWFAGRRAARPSLPRPPSPDLAVAPAPGR